MGRVFLARRVGEAGFERFYAVKVMHDHLAEEPEAVAMLIDEAKIASRLHHPNVVPITDIGNAEGTYYLVMDYVEGCSLSELLRRTRSKRPPRLVVPLILDALRGLHAAHEITDSAGVSLDLIHRDFSPQNILVGVDGTCRVTDFGIAKASARLTHTRSTVQKGKISYMAPEQLTEEVELDRRADIWAAGVVLWQCLTGEHPFKGPSEAATVHSILERPIPPPSIVGLGSPRCFDELCLRALSRDRTRRFPTAEAMADELLRIVVRNDLLAPQSEVAAWVQASIAEDLAKRRQLIKTIEEGGAQVTWLTAPVLPRIALTPSEGTRRGGATPSRSQNTPTVDRPGETSTRRPGAIDRLWRPLPKNTKTVIGAAIGSLLGFALCMLVFAMISAHLRTPSPESTSESDVTASSDQGQAAATAAVDPSELAPAATTRRDEETHRAQPSPVPHEAHVALTNVPEGATIRLDGRPLDSSRFTIPIDGRERVIRLDHPSYLQWQQTFVADGDVTFAVKLRPRSVRRHSTSRHNAKTPSRIVRNPGF